MKCDCCGMEFSYRPIAIDFMGRVYYFCSEWCAYLYAALTD